jgi:hypothetical protein
VPGKKTVIGKASSRGWLKGNHGPII